MSDVRDVGCWGCGMLGMWDVKDVGCAGCRMCGMWDVRDVACAGCGMFGMWDVWDVGCGMWDVCRDVGCWFTKCLIKNTCKKYRIKNSITTHIEKHAFRKGLKKKKKTRIEKWTSEKKMLSKNMISLQVRKLTSVIYDTSIIMFLWRWQN